MKKILVILQILLISTVISAKQFAVANIEGSNVPENQIKLITNALRSHITRESKGDIVSPADMANAQGDDVTTNKTALLKLGKEVDANIIVSGVIQASGDDFTLTVTLYDVKKKRKLESITEKTDEGFGGVMKTVLSDVANKIVNSKKIGSAPVVEEIAPEPIVEKEEPVAPVATNSFISDDEVIAGLPTNVIVATQPDGGEVYLDGSYIGISSVLYSSTSGPHQISIKMDGYRDTTIYEVFRGENNILDIPLYADKVSDDFKDVSNGVSMKSITRISTVIIAVGSIVGGIVLNSQIEGLNSDYEDVKVDVKYGLKAGDRTTAIGNDIRSKILQRNVLYGVSGAAVVGFGVTFFF